MIDIEKTIEDLKLLNALCHGTVLDDSIALLKEMNTVEHAKEVLCRNGWEKIRFPDGAIGKFDDPEIVRCKDCANYAPCKENLFDIQGICMRMNQPTDNAYFCADGVKKDG